MTNQERVKIATNNLEVAVLLLKKCTNVPTPPLFLVRDAYVHVRVALSTLQNTEQSLVGVPEPRESRE